MEVRKAYSPQYQYPSFNFGPNFLLWSFDYLNAKVLQVVQEKPKFIPTTIAHKLPLDSTAKGMINTRLPARRSTTASRVLKLLTWISKVEFLHQSWIYSKRA